MFWVSPYAALVFWVSPYAALDLFAAYLCHLLLGA